MRPLLLISTFALLLPAPGRAQQTAAVEWPDYVRTMDGIVEVLYRAVQRAPGEPYRWELLRTVTHPEAIFVPSTEQRGGSMDVLSVDEFIEWIDGVTVFGGPDDLGFSEEEIAHTTVRYGDVAQRFSTYRKHFWEDDEILGMGINAITLVWNDGRWWVTAIAWDEEVGAGPIPSEFLPREGVAAPGGGDAAAGPAADSAAVVATALDYIEGWFTGDAERMRRALHPDLVKRQALGPEADAPFGQIGAGDLIAGTERGGGRDLPDAVTRTDVEILDLFRNSAAVRIDAGPWIDWLHLVRTDEGWRIVNVLWELTESR